MLRPPTRRPRRGALALLTLALTLLTGCAAPVVLLVTIASPNAAVITNGTVTVQVAVEGGTPSGVSLLLDGALLVELSAPYTYAWDTAGTAEADYQVTARATAGAASFDSDPLVVTVDRTAPTITTRTPTPGGSSVWLGEPIRVAFSEPLDAATLTDTTVELLDGATPLAKTIALDPDAGALTLTLDQTPILPTTLTVALSPSIADRAGNALALPAGAWSWDVGAFALYGGALNGFAEGAGGNFPGLALGTDDLPLVAWPESDGSIMRTFVRRWNGSSWLPLGGPLSSSADTEFIFVTALALDGSGAPIVAWDEIAPPFESTVHVRRWDGSDWQPLGAGFEGFVPTMIVDDDDRPVVAASTLNGTTIDLTVRRWDGGSWVQLGPALSAHAGDTSTAKPSLAFDGSQPIVAWNESDGAESRVYVRRWDGAAWQPIGTPIDAVANEDASLTDLATESDGTPVVAFREDAGSEPLIFAYRWTGAAWSPLGSGFDAVSGGLAGNVALAIDPSDRPVAVWVEAGTGISDDIHAARFEGGSWNLLPIVGSAVPGDTTAAVPSIAIDGGGDPWIVWVEEGDPTSVYVQSPNALP